MRPYRLPAGCIVRITVGFHKNKLGAILNYDPKGLYQVAFAGEMKKPWFAPSQLQLEVPDNLFCTRINYSRNKPLNP